MKPQQLEFDFTAEVFDLLKILCNRSAFDALKPKPTKTGMVLPFDGIAGRSQNTCASMGSQMEPAHHTFPEPNIPEPLVRTTNYKISYPAESENEFDYWFRYNQTFLLAPNSHKKPSVQISEKYNRKNKVNYYE